MKEMLPISIYIRSYNNLIDNSNICQGTIERIMAVVDRRLTEYCLDDVINWNTQFFNVDLILNIL